MFVVYKARRCCH